MEQEQIEKKNKQIEKKITRNLTTLIFAIVGFGILAVVSYNVESKNWTLFNIAITLLCYLGLHYYSANNYFIARLEEEGITTEKTRVAPEEEEKIKEEGKLPNLKKWDYVVFFVKEVSSLGVSILIAIAYLDSDLFDQDKEYIYIGLAFILALVLLLISYNFLEKLWCKDMYKFRQAIDLKINVANLVNVLTGVTTLVVFVIGENDEYFALTFSILAIVYTYYIFYNLIYVKNS